MSVLSTDTVWNGVRLKHKHYQPSSQLPRDRDTISEGQNVKSKPYKNRIIGLYIHILSLERNEFQAEQQPRLREGLGRRAARSPATVDLEAAELSRPRCHLSEQAFSCNIYRYDPIICRLFIIYLISSGFIVSMKKEGGVGVSVM